MNCPFSVRAEVTGSVAINTAPKAKPPSNKCSTPSWAETLSAAPKLLKSNATSAPPAKTLNIVRQEAMRVQSKRAAPNMMAMNEVSPMEPGIKPVNISQTEVVMGWLAPAWPRAVAAVKPSGRFCPNPNTCSVLTHTASPLIFVGHAKNRKARVTSAGLKMFIPVPP